MTEFSEVMRQFDRMCKEHAGCVDCPLATKGSIETKCSIGSFIDESEYVEREVMQWAAEHPEPVYPTWVDWLVMVGVLGRETRHGHDYYFVESAMFKPIPADIAEKLGLEPKEE